MFCDFFFFFVTHCRVIPSIRGVFQIKLLNVNNTSYLMKRERKIGSLNKIEETVARVEHIDSSSSVNLESNIVYGDNLSGAQKTKVRSLVSEYQDVFAQTPKSPNWLPICTIVSFKRKPYRLPHAWHSEIDEQIEEMLDNGISRPSSSPWNSPIILVKKKDGSMRFVCDFRGLNDVTKKDSYPLPHIRDVIDRMHGSQFWTTLVQPLHIG